MKEEYIKIKNLSVSEKLFNFIDNDLLPQTNVSRKDFWDGFDKAVHELTPKNEKLLAIRDELQKKIDQWHKERKGQEFDSKEYTEFLKKINYLKEPGENFKIQTKNNDDEIAKI